MTPLETWAIFLDGARVAAGLVCAAAMGRLARRSHERLYAAFALAFVLLTTSTVLTVALPDHDEHNALAFVPRLLGFLLIIGGIVDRNRRSILSERKRRAPSTASTSPPSASPPSTAPSS